MKRSHGNRFPGEVNSVKAKCHPNRPHEALGLCGSCYTLAKHRQQVWVYSQVTAYRYMLFKQIITYHSQSCQQAVDYQINPAKNDPAKGRRHKVKLQLTYYRNTHGWTPEMVEEAKRVQRNRCAICKVIMHDPQADHEHTNPPNPRELLCRTCNIGLGHFKDSPKLLQKAALYVKKHRR